MFPLEVYKRLREEQRELAVRIGRLNQFIDNHDNMGTNKELNDDYMDILRDQLESMKDYNSCLIHRIGIAVTEGIAPQERNRCNQAILRDVKKFRESCEPDPRDPAPKQDSDKVVTDDEDAHNFFGFHVERWTDVL
jgi:hypothetical protein